VIFKIKTAQAPSLGLTRKLILESLGPHVGVDEIIDPELPLNGSPILALDTEGHPLIISFDTDDGAEALLMGLNAWDELQSSKPWLARLYPTLTTESISHYLRLMVLSPDLPPGARCLTEHPSFITFYTFRVLRLNTETVILIEPQAITQTDDRHSEMSSTIPKSLADECEALGLDEEETAFFNNIKQHR
jgi:hypothetical protein